MNNYNFLKMCVIGVIPLLISIDCLSCAALCSLLFFSSTTMNVAVLYCMKNISNRAKYLSAVMPGFAFNYFLYNYVLARSYCTGGYGEAVVFVSAVSVVGIYFDYEFKHFNDFFDLIKYYSIAIAFSTSVFFIYGILVVLFSCNTPYNITFFSYPCSAVITAALCGMAAGGLLKRINR